MRHQANARQILPFEQVDDVGDVGVEVDVVAEQVRAVADAGQRGGVDLVTAGLQQVGHPPPAPAAVPGAVDQHEGLGGRNFGHFEILPAFAQANPAYGIQTIQFSLW